MLLIPPHPLTYNAPLVTAPFEFSGNLESGAWAAAPWTEIFIDIEADKKPKPRFRTRAKMMWDKDYFYVAAEMEEPNLWATYTEHDSVIFHENDFEVFIDPDGDNHNYFEYEINALGTDWDLRLPKPYRDGGPALNEWEIPGIRTKITLNGTLNKPEDKDDGWVVEIAFPWSAFKEFAGAACPPSTGDIWRVNFSRVEWDLDVENGQYKKIPDKPEYNWVWSPQHVIDMHRPEMWGYVKFLGAGQKAEPFTDPLHEAKHRLMSVYHAQKAHFAEHERWAANMEELGHEDKEITVRITRNGWTATLNTTVDGKPWTATVDQHSQLLSSPD